ncbi:MAG: hypothetical protein VX000_16235 [Myxococcota bacterium]|nr:hypothetical protein [Myxococcota bacterium]
MSASRFAALAALVTLSLLSTGCKDGGKADTGEAGRPVASSVALHPPVGGQGTSMEVRIDANASVFAFDGTSVDFGEGIRVDGVNVDDGWGSRVAITIEPDAALGKRTVEVRSDGRRYTLTDAFDVIAESFRIAPETVRIGEAVDIDIVGTNTAWLGGVTWPNFGEGIDVVEFSVLSETLATASLSVSPDTAPGWRNVVMDNGGGSLVTLYDGLKVDRVSLAATFDPPVAEQGDTVEFTVFARGTDFQSGTPRVGFADRYGPNPDVVVDTVTVLDAENLYGRMTLSNAAALGNRDVTLELPDEGLLIPDAFEVIGGEWDLSEVAVDLSFTVVRSRDNNGNGEYSERVRANCTFFIPLDPPCPSGGGGSGSGSEAGSDPSPYDNNGVWMATGEGSGGGQEDCPFPTTVSAGDYVWLESDQNSITLEKQIDTASGSIYYTAPDIQLEDYVTDNMYDLHTSGDPEAIGEFVLDEVLPTVPSDWQWVAPDLWGNHTHNRAEDFAFSWTPALTYPDAMFVVSICTKQSPCPMAEESWSGYAGAYPWDDGSHLFTASEMSMMGAGGVPVYAYSVISGREFGLPDSIYQTNQATSYIYLSQYMVLE